MDYGMTHFPNPFCNLSFNPVVIPLAVAAIISSAIAIFGLKRRQTTGALPLTLLTFSIAAWTTAYMLEISAIHISTKVFWAKIQYLPIPAVPLFWLVFALEYTGKWERLDTKKLILLSVMPVLTVIVALTNYSGGSTNGHHLIWNTIELAENGTFSALHLGHGVWFWMNLAYCYVLLFLATIFLLRFAHGTSELFSSQGKTLIAGALAPWLGNFIYVTGLSPIHNLDPTPFAFTISGITMAWALFHHQFLDIVPVARDAVMERMNDAVIVIDAKNRIVDINPAGRSILIESNPDVIGKNISELLPKIGDFIEQTEHHKFLTKKISFGDKTRHYSMHISNLPRCRGNNRFGKVIVIRDITHSIHAQEILMKSNQDLESMLVQSEKMASIGQLATGVAHEINNPVGYITSNLRTLRDYITIITSLIDEYEKMREEFISEDKESGTARAHRIDRIREEEDIMFILEDLEQVISESSEGAGKIAEIVRNLKSFARVNEKRLKEADINEGIEATLKVIWNELKYKCHVDKQLNPLPVIHCHPGELNQVFMNILVNAAQAIPEKGEISISTEAENGSILVRISDTGTGIPPEKLSRIFDPFYTTKERGVGTGLGLSISHGIIEKHKGTIDVRSEVGKGSIFTIKLPVDGE